MITKELITQLSKLDTEKDIYFHYEPGIEVNNISIGILNIKNNDIFTGWDILDVSAEFDIDKNDLIEVNVITIGG